jgi:hypothetical protein
MADGEAYKPLALPLAICAIHGSALKRSACGECNAAYMRDYLRNRRQFPIACPALGITLKIGSARSGASPSLDRIDPHKGYVNGNVRVISDRANQLKGAGDLRSLSRLATTGRQCFREEYAAIFRYIEREFLLVEVRRRALLGGRHGEEWAKVASFLDRVFRGVQI